MLTLTFEEKVTMLMWQTLQKATEAERREGVQGKGRDRLRPDRVKGSKKFQQLKMLPSMQSHVDVRPISPLCWVVSKAKLTLSSSLLVPREEVA